MPNNTNTSDHTGGGPLLDACDVLMGTTIAVTNHHLIFLCVIVFLLILASIGYFCCHFGWHKKNVRSFAYMFWSACVSY